MASSSSSFLVSPSISTGNNRRIELAGMDLWLLARIDNVFVYPSEIKIEQFKEALSRTLSLWPFVAGRILLENNQHYIIEMCDNPIPVTFVINNDLKEWPLDSNAVVEADNKQFPTFIDQVDVTKFFNNSPVDEPFVRFKLTHIVQSDEWILGISWYHPLGDATACLHFSNTLSRFYQQMEPTKPLPIFERRLWREDEADQSVFSIPKQFQDAQSLEEAGKIYGDHQLNYAPINLHFSSKQLATLRTLAGSDNITIQDALTAYIILTLNTNCYYNNDERRILHTVTVVNFRGVSDSIAPQGQVSNSLFMMLSNDFDDPYSLSSIAKTVRQSIIQLRNPEILASGIATIDGFMRKNARDKKLPNPRLITNEFAVNSNYRFDWAGLVDFGYTDQCRFYTIWSGALYLRAFRLNPEKDGEKWLPRDRDGAEASFRIEKDLKEIFLNACKRDFIENFQNIKK
ncbi:unnamed protein product [Rotaria sp. Silwood2]|nr:unnamed protein product [Rotaria sp. Silwood2]CAF2930506.1 unnamed protein product [Rotaria sp. Silwood2]CAF3231071.1 unnamed protein product [Rotaria sp. Silwood2]CAF3283763.1 unnamed protein product [Rotaria sp. Silwood2]CAF4295330.1 unnamed protein product [Rotaria sp. Silwood2]